MNMSDDIYNLLAELEQQSLQAQACAEETTML